MRPPWLHFRKLGALWWCETCYDDAHASCGSTWREAYARWREKARK